MGGVIWKRFFRHLGTTNRRCKSVIGNEYCLVWRWYRFPPSTIPKHRPIAKYVAIIIAVAANDIEYGQYASASTGTKNFNAILLISPTYGENERTTASASTTTRTAS